MQVISDGVIEIVDRYKWTHFLTITNRYIINVDQFIKKYKYFFKHLDKSYYSKYTMHFVVCEPFIKNHYHIHSLITNLVNTKTLNILCNNTFGMSLIQEYDETRNAKYYLANKCNNDKVEWDFYKINSKHRRKNG